MLGGVLRFASRFRHGRASVLLRSWPSVPLRSCSGAATVVLRCCRGRAPVLLSITFRIPLRSCLSVLKAMLCGVSAGISPTSAAVSPSKLYFSPRRILSSGGHTDSTPIPSWLRPRRDQTDTGMRPWPNPQESSHTRAPDGNLSDTVLPC